MRRVVKDVKKEKAIIESFNSFKELTETTKSRDVNFGNTRNGRLSSWEGVRSYEEAYNLLTYGWNEQIKRMKQEIKNLRTGESEKVTFKNDIVGFAPVVPNAIMGLPNSMINCVRVPKKSKVINIQVSMEFNSNINQDKVFRFGAELINTIMNLEKNGYRVKLEYINVFSRELSKNTRSSVNCIKK